VPDDVAALVVVLSWLVDGGVAGVVFAVALSWSAAPAGWDLEESSFLKILEESS